MIRKSRFIAWQNNLSPDFRYQRNFSKCHRMTVNGSGKTDFLCYKPLHGHFIESGLRYQWLLNVIPTFLTVTDPIMIICCVFWAIKLINKQWYCQRPCFRGCPTRLHRFNFIGASGRVAPKTRLQSFWFQRRHAIEQRQTKLASVPPSSGTPKTWISASEVRSGPTFTQNYWSCNGHTVVILS